MYGVEANEGVVVAVVADVVGDEEDVVAIDPPSPAARAPQGVAIVAARAIAAATSAEEILSGTSAEARVGTRAGGGGGSASASEGGRLGSVGRSIGFFF